MDNVEQAAKDLLNDLPAHHRPHVATDDNKPDFWHVLAYVKPKTPWSGPLVDQYVDTEEMRDRLIARFERDNLEVVTVPKKFFRVKELNHD